jgi:hypothetical protein
MSKLDDKLAAIQARADAATPGPWDLIPGSYLEHEGSKFYTDHSIGTTYTRPADSVCNVDVAKVCTPFVDSPDLNPLTFEESAANAAFLLDARTTVPGLLKALRFMRKVHWAAVEAETEHSGIADDSLATLDKQLLAILEGEE